MTDGLLNLMVWYLLLKYLLWVELCTLVLLGPLLLVDISFLGNCILYPTQRDFLCSIRQCLAFRLTHLNLS
ncbi:hypothetical protein F4775DRAFT_11978 [Biscogniauxia sp. FL1348]|nr:hypothetical protein F4775DRAFT_11978 [Biscogniauxia sp. FL1348]